MFKNLKIIKLENRALLKIKGEDSKEFLQALVTNNINFISNEKSIYSALLSPQGKYLYDFFIFQDSKSNYLIIDCEKKSLAPRYTRGMFHTAFCNLGYIPTTHPPTFGKM